MYDCMKKVNIRDYENIWLGSDIHQFHDKGFLYEPRGCKTRDEHILKIRKGFDRITGENDLIVLMGDLGLTCEYDEFIEFVGGIKCKDLFLIIGNHDNRVKKMMGEQRDWKCDPTAIGTKNSIQCLGYYSELTIQTPSGVPNMRDSKQFIVLCHYPIEIFNHQQHGAWHLCGHSHGNHEGTSLECLDSKRLDVGVENALKYWDEILFNYKQLECIMDDKSVATLDHHGETT